MPETPLSPDAPLPPLASGPPPLSAPFTASPLASAPPPPPPMASLAYSMPVRSVRPGVITAMGVASIIVACLSVLAGLYMGLMLIGFRITANFAAAGGRAMRMPTPNLVPAAAPPAQQATTQASGVVVTERGLESGERARVAAALGEMRFLSQPRLDQLDALLAKSGKDMFPATGDQPLTTDAAGRLVQAHTTGLSADPSVPGPDTFRTNGGRIELYDDRAVFYPTRGEIVRSAALAAANAGLTNEQVESIVRQAQSSSGGTMNPAQLAALRTLLSTPGQQFVSPVTVPTAVRSAQAMPNGSVSLTFPNGVAVLGPQGQTTSATGPNAASSPAFAGGAGARAQVNGAAMALASFATFASIGLAIFLFVSGILVLRDSGRGRHLHLIYACLKIPVTLLGVAAVWWLTSSFFEAVSASQAGAGAMLSGPLTMNLEIQQIVLGALGLSYAFALLIALQTRGVKDYYRTVLE